jgi:7-cyano-7-deazaguanine reductase
VTDAHQSQLGKDTEYDQAYSPEILFPLDRKQNRESLNLSSELPFQGEDKWTCYELSWLSSKGKPQVAIAYFSIPCDSPFMIESKSFKLYLNSLNHMSFASAETLENLLRKDLSKAAGATVSVDVAPLNSQKHQIAEILCQEPLTTSSMYESAECLDSIETDDFEYLPNPELLKTVPGAEEVNETLYSDLLRSNCPVTGQPDWGSVFIHYSGQKIDRESLLKYIVSFRQCQDFHEHCVERIFTDLQRCCQCDSLSVYARYTRRGGLDINPYRATRDLKAEAEPLRTPRQ